LRPQSFDARLSPVERLPGELSGSSVGSTDHLESVEVAPWHFVSELVYDLTECRMSSMGERRAARLAA
jgi:hypothetical protein